MKYTYSTAAFEYTPSAQRAIDHASVGELRRACDTVLRLTGNEILRSPFTTAGLAYLAGIAAGKRIERAKRK